MQQVQCTSIHAYINEVCISAQITWCCLQTKCTTIIIIKSNKLMDSTHVLAAAYDDQVHQPPERDSSFDSIFAPAYQTSPIEPVSTILKNVPFNPILELLTKSITHWKQ